MIMSAFIIVYYEADMYGENCELTINMIKLNSSAMGLVWFIQFDLIITRKDLLKYLKIH